MTNTSNVLSSWGSLTLSTVSLVALCTFGLSFSSVDIHYYILLNCDSYMRVFLEHSALRAGLLCEGKLFAACSRELSVSLV